MGTTSIRAPHSNSVDLDLQAVMKNLPGIQPNALEPVYSEDERVSD